jgi:UrcA family protein
MKSTPLIQAAFLAAALVGTAPLLAQNAPAPTPDEEITVTGRFGRVPDSVRTLSQAVSYSDLDLSTAAGKAEIRRRINLTARYLCDRLGESASSAGPAGSCRDAASRDAMGRLGTVEEHFAPRGTGWTAPRAWQPPYPADWATQYP